MFILILIKLYVLFIYNSITGYEGSLTEVANLLINNYIYYIEIKLKYLKIFLKKGMIVICYIQEIIRQLLK